MKLFLTLTFFILFPFKSFAQGNLQFNKVVFIEADTALRCIQGDPCSDSFLTRNIIVPVDKVLKIESISFYDNGYYGFYFNKQLLSNNAAYRPSFPIWLPTGNYTFKYRSFVTMTPSPASFGIQATYYISGIEFNIIP